MSNRKWVVIASETEFSHIIGISDNYKTALGIAYDFLFDVKSEDGVVPAPVFDECNETGFYIDAGDDERPFVVMILAYDEDGKPRTNTREQVLEWHKVGDLLPAAGETVFIMFNDGTARYAWQDWARDEKGLDRYYSYDEPGRQIYPMEWAYVCPPFPAAMERR